MAVLHRCRGTAPCKARRARGRERALSASLTGRRRGTLGPSPWRQRYPPSRLPRPARAAPGGRAARCARECRHGPCPRRLPCRVQCTHGCRSINKAFSTAEQDAAEPGEQGGGLAVICERERERERAADESREFLVKVWELCYEVKLEKISILAWCALTVHGREAPSFFVLRGQIFHYVEGQKGDMKKPLVPGE